MMYMSFDECADNFVSSVLLLASCQKDTIVFWKTWDIDEEFLLKHPFSSYRNILRYFEEKYKLGDDNNPYTNGEGYMSSLIVVKLVKAGFMEL